MHPTLPSAAPPDPVLGFVERALLDQYGIIGTVEPLPGEVDRNFRVISADRRRFVLRVHAPGSDTSAAELQAADPVPPRAGRPARAAGDPRQRRFAAAPCCRSGRRRPQPAAHDLARG